MYFFLGGGCQITIVIVIQFTKLSWGHNTAYSKVPIIRTGTYASSAVHTMYCQNCPMFGMYNRSFRVQYFTWGQSTFGNVFVGVKTWLTILFLGSK